MRSNCGSASTFTPCRGPATLTSAGTTQSSDAPLWRSEARLELSPGT
ncbi:hypothetical protein AB5I41_26670 [Sphingomonas sp. MMS24-JH45]